MSESCDHKWKSGQPALKRVMSGPRASRLKCEICDTVFDEKMLVEGENKMLKPEMAKNK